MSGRCERCAAAEKARLSIDTVAEGLVVAFLCDGCRGEIGWDRYDPRRVRIPF